MRLGRVARRIADPPHATRREGTRAISGSVVCATGEAECSALVLGCGGYTTTEPDGSFTLKTSVVGRCRLWTREESLGTWAWSLGEDVDGDSATLNTTPSTLSSVMRADLVATDDGLVVEQVRPILGNTGGRQEGDTITAIGGAPVGGKEGLLHLIELVATQTSFDASVIRADGTQDRFRIQYPQEDGEK